MRNLVPRPVGGLGGDGVRRRRAIGGRGFAAGRGGNSAEEADAGNGQDPHAPCTSCGIERVRRGQPAPGGDPAPADLERLLAVLDARLAQWPLDNAHRLGPGDVVDA